MKILLAALLFSTVSYADGPSVLNYMIRPHHQDESQFPVPDGGNLGAQLYGTDAGCLYINTGYRWEPVKLDAGIADRVFTTADVNLFVDPSGNDANACTSAGSAACLTPQGALNKIPKVLQHRATVNIAAGHYSCFVVSGFIQDNSKQQTSGGLLINGALATSTTLATGSATGTATGGTAGAGSVFDILIDSTATWTVNDLRGRYILFTGGTGSGQLSLISSNTATTITVVGTLFPVSDATTTYVIQDPSVFFDTPIKTLPTAISTPVNVTSCLAFADNQVIASGITLQNVRIVPSTGVALNVFSGKAPQLTNVQIVSNVGTSRILFNGDGQLGMTRVYSFFTSATVGVHLNLISGSAFVLNSLLVGGVQIVQSDNPTSLTFQNSESVNSQRGFREDYGAIAFFIQDRLGCDGEDGEWAINVGDRHDGATASGSVQVNDVFFTNCSHAFVIGGGNTWLFAVSGTTSRDAMVIEGGASVTLNNSGWHLTGTPDYLLGDITGSFSDIVLGGCLSSLSFSNHICVIP